jgi:ribosomal RNA-processing protein 12
LAGLQNLATTKMGLNGKSQNSHKMLNKKRIKNVMRDTYDESDDEKDRKINKSRNEKTTKKAKNTHIVKFTGDEYKNKSGKGDNLLQGKYEPFAYIQLNPKAISKKKKKDNIEIFEKIMQKK